MMGEFVTSEIGIYLMSLVFGVGVGLVVEVESRRAWIGSMLVTAVFVVQVATHLPEAVWAIPLFVVTLGITGVLAAVGRYTDSPLLVGEPYWRKVALMLVHGRRVRSAALAKREEELQNV